MKSMKEKAETISVCVRVRPLNTKEAQQSKEAWRTEGNSIVQVMPNGKPVASYAFDHVFTQEQTTDVIFDVMAKVCVRNYEI
jgi:hypothetical protein